MTTRADDVLVDTLTELSVVVEGNGMVVEGNGMVVDGNMEVVTLGEMVLVTLMITDELDCPTYKLIIVHQ